ncbi:unnamed protein product, partial [Notodromas monacha]
IFLRFSEKERKEKDVKRKTISLWTYLNSRLDEFLYPLYNKYESRPLIILPAAKLRSMKLWKSYYCRWNLRIFRPEQMSLRSREILACRSQLEKKLELLIEELRCREDQDQGNVPQVMDQHRLTMDALAFVQSPPLNTRRSRTIPNQYEFKTVGFLSTHQFIPLPSPGHPMTSFRLENAFPVRQLQAPSVDFRELAVGYLTSGNNSVITRYEEVLGYVDIVNDGPDIPRRIKASILVKYPREEKFERWVGLFESFKWAWVQYLAFFIPVYLCVQWLGNHLFAENKVFCHVVVGKEGNVASAFPTVGAQ